MIGQKFNDYNMNADPDMGELILDLMHRLYLRDTWAVAVHDSFWDWEPCCSERGLEEKICAACKRIVKRMPVPQLTWKVVSQTRATYFVLDNFTSNYQVIIIDFVDKPLYKGAFSFTVNIDPKKNSAHEMVHLRTYTESRHTGRASMNSPSRNYNYLCDCNILQVLYKSLKSLQGIPFENDECLEFTQSHTDIEMSVFRKTFYECDRFGNDYILCRSVAGFIVNESLLQERFSMFELSDKMDMITSKKKIEDIVRSSDTPLVDLSIKDWKFINEWSHQNGILGRQDRYINLVDLVKDQPYGHRFTDTAILDDGDSMFKFVENLELFEDDNLARYEFIYKIDNSRYLYITVDLKNANSFVSSEDIMSIYVNMIVRINKDMLIPSGIEETRKLVPEGLIDKPQILSTFFQYISLLMILKNRPTQYCVVESTKVADSGFKQKDRKNKTSNISVRRIIKSEYVLEDRVREKREETSDREYTVEKWTRREHYRHLKNGKIVHIGEQKCTRHLPIAQKEIHIKL